MKVFARVTGQEDNIGDIVLRRRYLQAAANYGPLYLFAGDHSEAYNEGLGCVYEKLFTSHDLWWSAMLTAARSEPVLLFDKPGELQNSWKFLRSQLKSHFRRRQLRPLGGTAVLLGVGMRHSLPWTKRVALRVALSDYKFIGWRDVRSHRELGMGELMPDWAFGETVVAADEHRDLLLVSMRSDRPMPSARWFNLIADQARSQGLRIEVVTQVGRDQSRSVELAARFGVAPPDWREADYSAQEQVLRACYRRARIVISDRMHVLIMAANEGAVPICLTDWSEEKIERHFEAIGFADVSFDLSRLSDSGAAELLLKQADRTGELKSKIAGAQRALEVIETDLQTVVRNNLRL